MLVRLWHFHWAWYQWSWILMQFILNFLIQLCVPCSSSNNKNLTHIESLREVFVWMTEILSGFCVLSKDTLGFEWLIKQDSDNANQMTEKTTQKTTDCSLPPVCLPPLHRLVPAFRQRCGLEVPAVPSVSGAERAAAGGSRSAAATEGGAEGNGRAAGQRRGRSQMSTTLTLHYLLFQTLLLCPGLFNWLFFKSAEGQTWQTGQCWLTSVGLTMVH